MFFQNKLSFMHIFLIISVFLFIVKQKKKKKMREFLKFFYKQKEEAQNS